MKLLYIQASPRLMRSHAKAIADAFVEAWSKFNPDAKVVRKNLFETHLPDFDGVAVDARYMVGAGKTVTPEQQQAWDKVRKISEDFASFDRYVIASPMWNFGLPYKLKHYLDLVIQPRITFKNTDQAYLDSLKQKKVLLFLSRGGKYPEGSPVDFQRPYLAHVFNMMGLSNTTCVAIEPTVSDPESVRKMHTEKINEALQLAKGF